MAEKDFYGSGALIASETLAALGIPGGTTISAVVSGYLKKRRREAIGILVEEISAGHHGKLDLLPEDADDFIQIIHRFSKAVEDGCARENLKLLAQVIAGQKKRKGLDPDAFLKWAHTISDLTRSELLLIGFAITAKDLDGDSYWSAVRELMVQGGYEEDEISALAASVARTGLLLPASAWDGLIYSPSPWLVELEQLINVKELTKTR